MAGLFAKPGEGRSKDTGTLRQGRCWTSSGTLTCASRETSWMSGCTTIGKAPSSDKKATHKSDWPEAEAYRSLFALLKCKTQFCKWISNSLWKDFSTHSSVQWDSQGESSAYRCLPWQSCQDPLRHCPGVFHPIKSCLQGCYIGGYVWAGVQNILTLSSTQQEPERRKGYTQSREQFLYRHERQQIKVCFFCYSVPCITKKTF